MADIVSPSGKLVGAITIQHLVLLALMVALGYIIYQRRFSPLAGVPGPVLASLSNLWWTLKIITQRDQAWEAVRLHKKYGPVVRIGPNEV